MRLSTTLVGVLALAIAARAQTTFTTNNFPSLPTPSAIAAGDLDADGDNDLLTAHPGVNAIAANLNLGGGAAWANGLLFGYPPAQIPVEVVIAQFDGGRVDYATVLQGTNQVAIHRAAGAWPGFLPPQLVAVGPAPLEAVAFDVDSDGDQDLAVICQNPSAVYILQNGGGIFGVVAVLPLSIAPHSITVGQFNLFGGPDLVVTGSAGTAFAEVLINTTVGPVTFAPGQLFGCDFRPFGVCSGDFNGDGYMDFATDNAAFSTVSVLLNDPTALAGTTVGFLRTDYPLAPGTIAGPNTEIACGDFDCDGDVDLAVTVNASNRVALLWNSGVGTFSPPTFAGAPVNCGDLIASDFDGDPWIDLATANSTSGDVSILLNDLAVGCCRHDFTAGISDGFGAATPVGNEEACPNPAVVAWAGLPARDFDGPAICGSLLYHTFDNLPGNIKSARLSMRMRAVCPGSPSDRFMLGWDGINSAMVFGQSVASLTGTPWTSGTFGGISLDLSAMPGGANLLPKLNTDGRLDLFVGPGTVVDAIFLQLETCANSTVGINLSVSPLVLGSTITWSVSGAPTSPPGGVFFLIGPAVGPGPTVPGGDLCLLSPSILTFAPTSGAGTASFSLPLPWSPFLPCIPLSNQALAFDGAFTVFPHSNTVTSYFFD
jgi:hypothetical protein